jgi:hypothetical protein
VAFFLQPVRSSVARAATVMSLMNGMRC